MGYPNFGNNKTLVLPLFPKSGGFTIDGYKEKTGIDLRDFLKFTDDGQLRFVFDGLVLLNIKNMDVSFNERVTLPTISVITDMDSASYVSGEQDGYISFNSHYYFLRIVVANDVELSYENVRIVCNEI